MDAADANAAKKLRNAFIRKHCAATFVSVPTESIPAPYFASLTALESRVQSMAPPGMRAWEGVGFASTSEPTELVDSLLLSLPHLAKGAEKQRLLCVDFGRIGAN